ncbi:hypothetical protein [Arsenicicoccus sp. oral taxon 190]|uniref:hypothetical protein n=1 Tax=Arsenicicoccus sp. oral taxon 190 TaxID=1658671 RepID=UPI000679F7F3|nr:hypothetical protein [Arsenicicoccus sp. oral taxon 190]AKT51401.1 hypothetical protein ADJ73_08840 [Arsenicicoccus sp. oral taxon 190]
MDEDTMTCSSCGRQAEGPDLAVARVSWTFGVERGRPVWTCAECSRRHARSIEAKLDAEWW